MEKEDVVYIYNGIIFHHKKKGILPFVTTWMDVEEIMLNEMLQRKTNTKGSHMWSLKNKITIFSHL